MNVVMKRLRRHRDRPFGDFRVGLRVRVSGGMPAGHDVAEHVDLFSAVVADHGQQVAVRHPMRVREGLVAAAIPDDLSLRVQCDGKTEAVVLDPSIRPAHQGKERDARFHPVWLAHRDAQRRKVLGKGGSVEYQRHRCRHVARRVASADLQAMLATRSKPEHGHRMPSSQFGRYRYGPLVLAVTDRDQQCGRLVGFRRDDGGQRDGGIRVRSDRRRRRERRRSGIAATGMPASRGNAAQHQETSWTRHENLVS